MSPDPERTEEIEPLPEKPAGASASSSHWPNLLENVGLIQTEQGKSKKINPRATTNK